MRTSAIRARLLALCLLTLAACGGKEEHAEAPAASEDHAVEKADGPPTLEQVAAEARAAAEAPPPAAPEPAAVPAASAADEAEPDAHADATPAH